MAQGKDGPDATFWAVMAIGGTLLGLLIGFALENTATRNRADAIEDRLDKVEWSLERVDDKFRPVQEED